jgi:hypothetical protein
MDSQKTSSRYLLVAPVIAIGVVALLVVFRITGMASDGRHELGLPAKIPDSTVYVHAMPRVDVDRPRPPRPIQPPVVEDQAAPAAPAEAAPVETAEPAPVKRVPRVASVPRAPVTTPKAAPVEALPPPPLQEPLAINTPAAEIPAPPPPAAPPRILGMTVPAPLLSASDTAARAAKAPVEIATRVVTAPIETSGKIAKRIGAAADALIPDFLR